MAAQAFEVQQVLKAYRKGLIPDELFEQQMKELGTPSMNGGAGGLDVVNVLQLRGKMF